MKNFVRDVMDRNYDFITFIQITFNLKKSTAANFTDIIKNLTTFIKTTFKVKRIRNYILKLNLYLYFLI